MFFEKEAREFGAHVLRLMAELNQVIAVRDRCQTEHRFDGSYKFAYNRIGHLTDELVKLCATQQANRDLDHLLGLLGDSR